MQTKPKIEKEVFSIRMPTTLSRKLDALAEEIGISKCAVILSLLHKALEDNTRATNRSDEN